MTSANKLKQMRNYDALRIANLTRLRRINNIIVEAHLVISGLQMLKSQLDYNSNLEAKSTAFTLDVPSTKKSKTTTIRRQPQAVKKIIDDRITPPKPDRCFE